MILIVFMVDSTCLEYRIPYTVRARVIDIIQRTAYILHCYVYTMNDINHYGHTHTVLFVFQTQQCT